MIYWSRLSFINFKSTIPNHKIILEEQNETKFGFITNNLCYTDWRGRHIINKVRHPKRYHYRYVRGSNEIWFGRFVPAIRNTFSVYILCAITPTRTTRKGGPKQVVQLFKQGVSLAVVPLPSRGWFLAFATRNFNLYRRTPTENFNKSTFT